MKSKKCFKCGETKAINAFYKHPMMADGRLGKCKECSKKDVVNNRLNNIDYYREYDRNRGSLPKRINARKEYARTDAGKNSKKKSMAKWLENNANKKAAHTILGNAVMDGKIIKPKNCETCGVSKKMIHGHHDDYSYPLSVKWLCAKCHFSLHKETR